MKIKQHLLITDPERFLRNNYDGCFSLYTNDPGIQGWISCGAIELTCNVDMDAITKYVLNEINDRIEKEESEYNEKMRVLKSRRDELLALPFHPRRQ